MSKIGVRVKIERTSLNRDEISVLVLEIDHGASANADYYLLH